MQDRDAAAEVTPSLVAIGRSFAQTYQPVLEVADWKVAMLRYLDIVAPDMLHRMERHRNTDEVFILTVGRGDLIICAGDRFPTVAHVIAMEPNVAYNVKQSVWHHVALSPDAHIVLFERRETGPDTTDYAELAPDDIARLKAQLTVGATEGNPER